jgi:transcriptional regulator with XRE-family HTH domain
MVKKRITQVLAENLDHFMRERGITQQALALKSGVGQTTISLYLRPEARKDTHSGGAASPTLAKIEALASALEVDMWELLRPLTANERDLLRRIELVVAEQMAKYEPTPSAASAPPKGARRKPHARAA